MPGGVVTAGQIHGNRLLGYWEGTVAVAGTAVPYPGPSVPVQAIATCKKATIATTPTLTFDWANPNTTNNTITVFSTAENDYRITWISGGG